MIHYFATCARGLEPVLAQELTALQASDVQPGRGGVRFAGDGELLYKANLWLRTAVRVLRPLHEAEVSSPDELYDMVRTIDWSQYLTPDHTLAVDCNVRDSNITHSQYAARRVKDAICDQFMEKVNRRPSVDVERPMLGFNLHIHRNVAVLSMDSSWDSLHKRGYRPILNKAPINEALAAGLILHTGWQGDSAFLDPMCGSGTFAIEAAWIALNRPPGLTRKHFGFMGWLDYNVGLWSALRDDARARIKEKLNFPITGYDIRQDAIDFACTNAKAAGVGHLLDFQKADIADLQMPIDPYGVLMCNPPYGERIGEDRELRPLYATMGEAIARCRDWDCYVFTSDTSPWRELRLKTKDVRQFWNGTIGCRLMKFQPR